MRSKVKEILHNTYRENAEISHKCCIELFSEEHPKAMNCQVEAKYCRDHSEHLKLINYDHSGSANIFEPPADYFEATTKSQRVKCVM